MFVHVINQHRSEEDRIVKDNNSCADFQFFLGFNSSYVKNDAEIT